MSWLGPVLLACGIICALIAPHKNRSQIGYFIIGALFGPIGVVACAIFPAAAVPPGR